MRQKFIDASKLALFVASITILWSPIWIHIQFEKPEKRVKVFSSKEIQKKNKSLQHLLCILRHCYKLWILKVWIDVHEKLIFFSELQNDLSKYRIIKTHGYKHGVVFHCQYFLHMLVHGNCSTSKKLMKNWWIKDTETLAPRMEAQWQKCAESATENYPKGAFIYDVRFLGR